MLPGQPLCTATSIDIVRWTARLGAVTAEALAERHAATPAQARARLLTERRAGRLAHTRPLHAQPTLYTATRAGLRHAGATSLGVCRVSASNALHLITCASVAVALEQRHPDHRIEGERELRRAEHDQRRPVASARLGLGPEGEARLHRPDLVLWPRSGPGELPVAIEVELTIKAPRRLAELCQAWARCRLVAGVVYYAPPDVARALARAIGRVRARESIVVVPLEAVLRSPHQRLDRNVPSGA